MTTDATSTGAELRTAVARLYSRFRSERLPDELPEASMTVLVLLSKAEPLTLTELARRTHVALGSVRQTVRRLETQGYLSKRRGTEDRRTTLYSLTESGRAAAVASRDHRRTWLMGRLETLSPEELQDVRRVARLLLSIADS